jgi:predicted XRE-type DNA-binding protein
LANLRWGTRSENCMDAVRHHGGNRGEKNGYSKLSSMGVRVIRRLLELGTMSQRKIAKVFGVSQTAVYQIGNGQRWGWSRG